MEMKENQYVFIPKWLLLALTWTPICVLHPPCFLTMQTNRPQMESAVHWWFTSCCFRGAACRGVLGAAWSNLIGDSPLWLQPGITSSLQHIWRCCLPMKISLIQIYLNTIHLLSKHTHLKPLWYWFDPQTKYYSCQTLFLLMIQPLQIPSAVTLFRETLQWSPFKSIQVRRSPFSEKKRPCMQIKYSSNFFQVIRVTWVCVSGECI